MLICPAISRTGPTASNGHVHGEPRQRWAGLGSLTPHKIKVLLSLDRLPNPEHTHTAQRRPPELYGGGGGGGRGGRATVAGIGRRNFEVGPREAFSDPRPAAPVFHWLQLLSAR